MATAEPTSRNAGAMARKEAARFQPAAIGASERRQKKPQASRMDFGEACGMLIYDALSRNPKGCTGRRCGVITLQDTSCH